jgi:hypothetical protein
MVLFGGKGFVVYLQFLLDGFTYGFNIHFQGERNTEFMKILFRPNKT